MGSSDRGGGPGRCAAGGRVGAGPHRVPPRRGNRRDRRKTRWLHSRREAHGAVRRAGRRGVHGVDALRAHPGMSRGASALVLSPGTLGVLPTLLGCAFGGGDFLEAGGGAFARVGGQDGCGRGQCCEGDEEAWKAAGAVAGTSSFRHAVACSADSPSAHVASIGRMAASVAWFAEYTNKARVNVHAADRNGGLGRWRLDAMTMPSPQGARRFEWLRCGRCQ